MNIPEKIKIGGKVYKVNVTDRLESGLGSSAEICYNTLEINLRPYAQAKMEADFLHEIVHGIMEHIGLTDHDEVLVDGIAQGLHMVIVDNPGIFSEAVEPVRAGSSKIDLSGRQ